MLGEFGRQWVRIAPRGPAGAQARSAVDAKVTPVRAIVADGAKPQNDLSRRKRSAGSDWPLGHRERFPASR